MGKFLLLTASQKDDKIILVTADSSKATVVAMDVEFADGILQRLETDLVFNAGYGVEVVRGFRKVMRFIRSAKDERDFWAMRGLRFEKLKGDRRHQHSFRINDQWRLAVELKKGTRTNVVVIVGIVDYH